MISSDNREDQVPLGLIRHLTEVFSSSGDVIIDWNATNFAGKGLFSALMTGRSCICVIDENEEIFKKVNTKFEELLGMEEELLGCKSSSYKLQDPECHCVCDCEDRKSVV